MLGPGASQPSRRAYTRPTNEETAENNPPRRLTIAHSSVGRLIGLVRERCAGRPAVPILPCEHQRKIVRAHEPTFGAPRGRHEAFGGRLNITALALGRRWAGYGPKSMVHDRYQVVVLRILVVGWLAKTNSLSPDTTRSLRIGRYPVNSPTCSIRER